MKSIGFLKMPYASPSRVSVKGKGYGRHRPTTRCGPLCPLTWEAARRWLGSLPRKVIGFQHWLEQGNDGVVMVREKGEKLPIVAYMPPREWRSGTASSQNR